MARNTQTTFTEFKVSVDHDNGLAYFTFTDHAIARTITYGDNIPVAVDVDADGAIVGVEFLAWPKDLTFASLVAFAGEGG